MCFAIKHFAIKSVAVLMTDGSAIVHSFIIFVIGVVAFELQPVALYFSFGLQANHLGLGDLSLRFEKLLLFQFFFPCDPAFVVFKQH